MRGAALIPNRRGKLGRSCPSKVFKNSLNLKSSSFITSLLPSTLHLEANHNPHFSQLQLTTMAPLKVGDKLPEGVKFTYVSH